MILRTQKHYSSYNFYRIDLKLLKVHFILTIIEENHKVYEQVVEHAHKSDIHVP